jgi:hypothetical protein
MPAFANNDIELALLVLDLREQTIKIGQVRYIASDARHISSDLLHRRDQLRIPAPRNEHVRAFVHKLLRPMPLVPPVISATLPSSLPTNFPPIPLSPTLDGRRISRRFGLFDGSDRPEVRAALIRH